ncbi:MAG: hypothetical protein ACLGHJ_09375 [Gammaproteobacteria bacterium]
MTSRPASLRLLATLMLVSSFALLQGCMNFIYKQVGNQTLTFSKNVMVPYLLTFEDTQMACASGEALTPLLMTFEAVGSDPNQQAIMVYTAAGMCAESRALEEELRYLRAAQQQNITEAQDARIAQKRWHRVAAMRQYEAYKRFVQFYGEPPAGKCTKKLDSEFDQLMYIVGLVSGVQSLLNDTQADQTVGVPRDIAAKVERMAACIKDSNKWWGLPQGIRASLWNILPMLAPQGSNPMKTLATVAKEGERRGVRIGYAMWALSAYGNGDKQLTKDIIRSFAEAGRTAKIDPDFRMMDAMAEQMIHAMSDRLWTEATGTRTPIGGLGTFWDDKPKSAGNIDDLL